MACKLSWSSRKTLKVQPTVQEVNQQRILWQKRCYELLDWILCNYCNDEKEEAFDKGLGLDWVPDNWKKENISADLVIWIINNV